MDKLTDKQALFCQEYIIDLNATQAAIRAGYPETSARSVGCENLTKPDIQDYISELKEGRSISLDLDAKWVLMRFKTISDRCSQAEPSMVYDPVNKCMVQDTTEDGQSLFKFDSAGANKATEMIGKHIGFFGEHNKQKSEIRQVFKIGDQEIEL